MNFISKLQELGKNIIMYAPGLISAHAALKIYKPIHENLIHNYAFSQSFFYASLSDNFTPEALLKIIDNMYSIEENYATYSLAVGAGIAFLAPLAIKSFFYSEEKYKNSLISSVFSAITSYLPFKTYTIEILILAKSSHLKILNLCHESLVGVNPETNIEWPDACFGYAFKDIKGNGLSDTAISYSMELNAAIILMSFAWEKFYDYVDRHYIANNEHAHNQ